ncbi:MAG: hypothetical protein PHT30_01690 [Bacilli bacterium]|nr:hypothetical protein [Bacilli bacterium]
MDTREKLNEFAELRGWNKNKPIGWSEAADFGDWLIKNCPIPDVANCATCKHQDDQKSALMCFHCDDYSNYKPKFI